MTIGDYLNSYMDDNDVPDGGVRHMIAEIAKDFL